MRPSLGAPRWAQTPEAPCWPVMSELGLCGAQKWTKLVLDGSDLADGLLACPWPLGRILLAHTE